MKKILLLVVAVVFAANLFAENVNQNKAQKIAKAFAAQRDRNAAQLRTDIVYSHPMPNTKDAAFYVVNLGKTGFVIVSANDVAHPVIGYSFDRPWPMEGNIPPQITDYLDDLAGQIEAASQNQPDQATKTEWQELLSINLNNPPQPKGDRTQVGPLLTTTWDQGQYYNAMCPEDEDGPDGHVVTGCVATAMAQIIKYHGYPISGRGIHSYQSNYGELSVNFAESNYDYTNMPEALTNESSETQVNAVAKLISDCGVAVNMGYTSGESSAYDQEARAALINFFKYSPNMSFAEKAFFTTDEWNTMLQTELNANRPIYYTGRGTGGHAFVCDGYNSDNYYHFNFGWSGSGNTWYLLDAVNPLGMNFNSEQAAVLGIVPDVNGNVILGQMQGTSTFTVDEPLEFYHLMGHNQYEGNNYTNPCNNTVTFVSADENQMVADIIEFEDQNIMVYDGNATNFLLRELHGGSENDLSPVVTTNNAVTLDYSGIFYYAGFQFVISRNAGCRMVSNIVNSIEATTVHLTWTENGDATQWQVEYGVKGFTHGNGTTEVVNSNTITIENLQKFTEYDFYIRSVCGTNEYGYWNKVTLMVEAPYWQDIITSQPVGYVINYSTNTVEISTVEGFAWWAKKGCPRNAYLTADIDLSEYKWRPVYLSKNLSGQRHTISNVYISEITSDVGLFSDCGPSVIIEDVGLTNAYVKSTSYRVGAMFGTFRGIMRNCYITNSSVDGGDYTGGLIGESDYGTVINCYVNTNVIGDRWTGLLIGNSWQGINRNCYAAGNVRHRSYCYIGGIAAYAGAGEITNCYSVKTDMGVVGYKGSTIISDTSTFVKTNLGCTLLTPIVFDGIAQTDLLAALNQSVEQYNDNIYCTWTNDINNINGGYPILGNKYEVQCPNISDLSLQNIKVGNDNAIAISWTESGDANQWVLRYRRHDMLDSSYTYVTLTNNPATIYGIPLGYAYDFSIRAICGTDNQSGWCTTQTLIVDLIYWTDIVTTQPAGYIEDNDGNVTISSAEGMAWLAAKVNGLNGHQPNTYGGKIVTLTTDIDLQGYRWRPIGKYNSQIYMWTGFEGTFDGQGHTIYNIYVNDAYSDLGLFGYVNEATIKNVNIDDGYVASIYTDTKDPHALHSSAIGGLIGYATDCYEISNCYSSATIHANGDAGSLCGNVRGDIINTLVYNCFAFGTVYGRESCGGLIGNVYGTVTVRNCYSTGDVNVASGNDNAWNRGGLIGLLMYATAINCYSIGSVELDPNSYGYYGKVIGCPYMNTHIHYIYGQDINNEGWDLIGNYCEDITNAAQFHHEGNINNLLDTVVIAEVSYTELLNALNAWVTWQGDQNLKTWVLDNNTGYPVLGDYYEPSCYNPSNLIASQATTIGNTTIQTELSWTQNGDPDHWEVLYVASEHDLDEGVIVTVNSNPCVLTDIPVGQPLDFYVRAVCDCEDYSNWSIPVTYIPDKLRWTEVVTSQPEGYQEDSEGNVYISSAEGLAWLSSVSNGLNGVQYNGFHFANKSIILTSDIDISAYKWTPIAKDYDHEILNVVVDGHNHTILGLYCNELSDFQGLFGYLEGSISNINIKQCDIYGEKKSGGLVGESHAEIINCTVSGNVYGVENTGGIVGWHSGQCIKNSCFIGNVAARQDISVVNTLVGYVGGICGVPFNDDIINCYVVSEIADDGVYSGIITGTGGGPHIVSNCYYQSYQTSLPATSSNSILENNSSFSGSGTTWTLNTPPYINGAFRTDLVDALNAWVDANNTNGEYLHWVADTAMVNEGFPILAVPTYYTITVDKNPANGGTVSGAGDYLEGATATLTATANTGYHFVNWTLDGSSISSNSSISITVTGNANYVANFELNSYEITATANPSAGGTVTGTGTYNYGTQATLTATANTGYHFVNWTLDGSSISSNSSLSITVTSNANYVANFELNSYQITATANPSAGGTVTGAGTYNYGAQATLTATANTGYHFVNWTLDGSSISSNSSISITVTSNANYVANFELNSYQITATANPTSGGTVTGAGTYNHGAQATLTATANTGYTFVNWTLDGSSISSNSSLSITVTDNANYVANFELNSYQITATANPSAGGTVSGSGTYNYGETCTLSVNLNENFTFINWTENGVVVSSDETYSFTVTDDRNIVANLLDHTGVGETISIINSLYPNPVSHTLTVETTRPVDKLEILTINGKVVYTQTNCGNKTIVQVSDFASGTYILKITSGKQITTQQFLKE